MLTSPITITIDGAAHSLSRINQDSYSSVYLKKAANLELRLTIRHVYEGKPGIGQMERHHVDLVRTTWDAEGIPSVQQSYHVVRVRRGADPDSVNDDTVGLNTWVSANIAAITAWES